MQQIADRISKKNVLFVTTKNADYIRNVQEINFLRKHARKLKIIYSVHTSRL